MRRSIHWSLALCLVLFIPGCDSDNPFELPTQPTTPLPTITDTFSGTVNVNGAITHPFGVQTGGQVIATLSTVSPEDTIIGLSLGTWNGVACQIVLANDSARAGARVVGNVGGLGDLCVRLYDVGHMTGPTSYEVQVVHP